MDHSAESVCSHHKNDAEVTDASRERKKCCRVKRCTSFRVNTL